MSSRPPNPATRWVPLVLLGMLAVGTGTGSILFPVLAAIVLGLLFVSRSGRASKAASSTQRLWLAAIVASGGASPYLLGSTYWAVALMMSAVGLIAALYLRRSGVRTVALTAFPLIASIVLIIAMPDQTIDVWFLHREAGTSLTEAGNPYADLQVPNGAPEATDEFIVGYPYPPVPLFTYGLLGALIGESRWVTVAAWLAVAIAFAAVGRDDERSRLLGWALVAHPSWALMLWSGWTEPLSVALIVATWALWKIKGARAPTLALALSSKQYFAIVGAVVAAARSLAIRTKILALAGAAALTAPALLWGSAEAYDALVGLHTRQPYRPDASTLFALLNYFGINVRVPSLVGLVLAAGIAAWLGYRSNSRSSLFLASAASLSVFFFLGSQAFANYWFVVFAYLICAMAGGSLSTNADQETVGSEAPHA